MKKVLFGLLVLILVAGPMLSCAPAGPAEKPEDFYKDKTVRWIIDTKPGGDHDLLVRLTAPYLKEYLGAHAIVLENNSEGGGVAGLNINWSAPPDGLTMSSGTPKSLVDADIGQQAGVQYKSLEFNVLVAMTSEIGQIVVVNPEGPYKSVADLQQAKGLKSAGTPSKALVAAYFADILGFDAKITPGVTTGDARLALLRGELDYFIESPGGIAVRIKSGESLPLCINYDTRHIACPDVPPITDFVKLSPEQKKWMEFMKLSDSGKWLYTGPNVPKDRVKYLRSVFEKIMEDPRYVEERATKYQRWPVPEPWLTGAEAQKLLEDYYAVELEQYDSMVKYLSEKYFTVK